MSKGHSGQSQLLIPIIIILTSVLALAANTTIDYLNSTVNNSTITGNFLAIPQTIEKSFPIEIFANTSISLDVKGNSVRATLTLDFQGAVFRL